MASRLLAWTCQSDAGGAWRPGDGQHRFHLAPIHLSLRFLLWLAWDLLVWTVARNTGWPLWRVLTLGRLPHAGFRDFVAAGTLEAILA